MTHFRIAPLVAAVFLVYTLPAAAVDEEAPVAVAQVAAPTSPSTQSTPSAPSAPSTGETGLGAWPIAAPARPFDRPLSPEDIANTPATDTAGALKIKIRSAPDQAAAPDSLWDRIRLGFGVTDMSTPLVKQQINWFANRPDFIKRTVERSSRYLYHIVEEVQKRGMPTEIALLPVIESAFNPVAYSRAHASGIWQFIPSTGKLYGLQQNFYYDGRRDVMEATRAALDYLQNLYGMFGSWDLALAAYNWGEGAVSRAIAKNTARGLPTDYQSLSMPAETRYYFPRLQAVKDIVANPELYGITLEDIPNRPYFTTVTTNRHIDMRVAAKLADTPLDEFMSLNPGYSRPVIRANSEQTLLVPLDKAEIFRANLENSSQQLVSWQAYQLKSGETLDRVAARYNVTVAYLRQVNGITPKRKIGAGSTVLVPGSGAATNLPDLPAPPVTVARTASKKSVKQTRSSSKQKNAAHKTTASAGNKIVVAHTSR